MNDFLDTWKQEVSSPLEIAKSTVKLADKLYQNGNQNSPEIDIIYRDIQRIAEVLTNDAPYDYAAINMQITQKYDSIPPVKGTIFYRVTLEYLESQTEEKNIETLALIAQSLQIMMANIKLGKVTDIVIGALVEHVVTAGFHAAVKVM